MTPKSNHKSQLGALQNSARMSWWGKSPRYQHGEACGAPRAEPCCKYPAESVCVKPLKGGRSAQLRSHVHTTLPCTSLLLEGRWSRQARMQPQLAAHAVHTTSWHEAACGSSVSAPGQPWGQTEAFRATTAAGRAGPGWLSRRVTRATATGVCMKQAGIRSTRAERGPSILSVYCV